MTICKGMALTVLWKTRKFSEENETMLWCLQICRFLLL